MKTIVRGAIHGAAFGVAVTCFETWFGVQRMMHLRMPSMPFNLGKAVVLAVLLGVVLGVLAAPLLRARRGAVLHALALALSWLALERMVAPDPSKVAMWVVPSLAGLVLLGTGRLVGRWSPAAAWSGGVAVLIAAIVVPLIVDRRRSEEVQRATARPASTSERLPDSGSADSSPANGAASSARGSADRPDVLVIVLDTVRAQNVSAYGYPRRTTPYLDELATEGALFLDATSPSTWSLPSHASLFTGLFPTAHGADSEHRILDDTAPTLAEVLGDHGYETRCFTANPHISDGFGLTRGFQWSDRAWLAGLGGRGFFFIYRVLDLLGASAADKGGGAVADNFEKWVRTRGTRERPAFAFINFLEAHFPYHQVPREFLESFTERSPRDLRDVSLAVFGAQFGRRLASEEVREATAPSIDMYDAGILYSDHLLKRAVEALRKAGTLDRTVLVVLADHGEMVGEHEQFGHGAGLYEPGIRVPLLVRYPARVRAGARVEQPVSTVGVYATVLDLARIDAPAGLQVSTLMPALDGRPAGAPVIAERYAFPESPDPGNTLLGMRDRRYRVYRSGAKKLVHTSKNETFLFNLAVDAGETRDLAASDPAEVARLNAELDAWAKALGLPPLDAPLDFKAVPALDEAASERLKALGYME